MLVHEPDGTTIGTPGWTEFKNRRASETASSRMPSLNATCPQQNAPRMGVTLSRSRSSTVAAASLTSGKNSSARQVENSWTSVIVRPHHDHVQRFRAMHAEHDSLFDIGGPARPRDQRQSIRGDALGTHRGQHRREIWHHAIDLNDYEARRRQQREQARPIGVRNDGEGAGRGDREVSFRDSQLSIGDARAHRRALAIRDRHGAHDPEIRALERLADRVHVERKPLSKRDRLRANLAGETDYSTIHFAGSEHS